MLKSNSLYLLVETRRYRLQLCTTKYVRKNANCPLPWVYYTKLAESTKEESTCVESVDINHAVSSELGFNLAVESVGS